MSGEQGVGVIVAQHPPATGQGFLVQLVGPLVVTEDGQVRGKVVSRD